MKEENKLKLKQELKYLLPEEIEKEIENNSTALESQNVDIKKLAQQIYIKRGIDYSKLNKGLFNGLGNTLIDFINSFKNQDKDIKKKMIIDLIYNIVLIILIKVPFNLVRDIGSDCIEILSTKTLYLNLWYLLFLILYTITIICVLIVLIRNFNNKYKK